MRPIKRHSSRIESFFFATTVTDCRKGPYGLFEQHSDRSNLNFLTKEIFYTVKENCTSKVSQYCKYEYNVTIFNNLERLSVLCYLIEGAHLPRKVKLS